MASPSKSSSVSRYWTDMKKMEYVFLHRLAAYLQLNDKKCSLFFLPQPAIVDNLLTSVKFVLQGMGMLRINLADRNNKVMRQHTLWFSKICFYQFCVCGLICIALPLYHTRCQSSSVVEMSSGGRTQALHQV